MLPLSAELLKAYLPHRGPMIWIDRVIEITPVGGRCEVTLMTDALYFKDGRLIPSAPIEWMAQAAGYCAAARIHLGLTPEYKKLTQTFLVGIRAGILPDLSQIRAGEVLQIDTEMVRQLPPLALIRGTISRADQELCSIVLKLYGQSDQPEINGF